MNNVKLLEYVSGEFRWGFELEACVSVGHLWDKHNVENVPNLVVQDFNHNIQNGAKWNVDSTVVPNEINDKNFEMQSPILPMNPATLSKVGAWLDSIIEKYDVYINDSCGFHIHISWPNVSPVDVWWVLCNVALNDKYLDKFRNFENIVFESSWSPTEELDKIRHAAKSNDPKTLITAMKRGYGAEKVTIARNHPLGTLEWRGPRNFIYPGNIQVIRKFMARIYRLVLDINNILENEQSLGGIISRQ